jgi:hypothetical protein
MIEDTTVSRMNKHDLIGKIVYQSGMSFYFFRDVNYFNCFGTPRDLENARFDKMRCRTKKREREIDYSLEKKLNGEWDGWTNIGRFESFYRKYPEWYQSQNMFKVERLEVV